MGNAESSKPLELLTELAGCASDLQTLSTIGLDTLKGQLAGLGGAMMLYAEGAQEITGVSGDQTGNVESAMGILRAITQAFANEGGFTLPSIPSEAELGSFGADLAALAGAIVKFADASNGLGDGTDKAIELLGFLSDLKTKLTEENLKTANAFNEAGVSGDVMTQFSTDIFALSGALKNFIDNTQGIDSGKIKTATDALGFFATLQSQLVAQDAVLAVINWFTGEDISKDQLEKFGKNIEQLGLALKNFAESVQLDESSKANFQTAIDSLDFFAELEKKLPTVGGIVSWVTGTKQTLTDLAAQVVLLGESIAAFNSSVTDENGESKLNDVALNSAITILGKITDLLGDLQTKMEPVPGFLAAFTGHKYDATNLKTDMENFTGVIVELVKISDLLNGKDDKNPVPNSEALTAAITALDSITTFIKNLGEKMPKSVPALLEVFTGESYDTTKLAADITNFETVISELVKAGNILNGSDEKSVKIDKDLFDSAVASIDIVLGFIKNLGEKMPNDNTFLDDIFTGEKYDSTKLSTDISNFTSVIGELNKISNLLNGNDKTHPLPSQEDITSAISAITPITNFVKDLGEKMPHSETFLAAFTGKRYDLTNLKTDIDEFGKVCDELKVITTRINGKGKDAITIDKDSMTAATVSVDAILAFVRDLSSKMPDVGGFLNTMDDAWNGRKYTTQDLNNHLDGFKDA
jgi:hypothetical protein